MKKIALILGGTGSIGFACAKLLAAEGCDVVIVHRSSKSKFVEIELKLHELRSLGTKVKEFNFSILGKGNLEMVIDYLKEIDEKFELFFLHAVADANIGELTVGENILTEDSFIHTYNSMAASFVIWTQKLFINGLMTSGSRVIGFTSEGSTKVISGYAAVAMAKSALEAACRYLSVDLAKHGITVNLIGAGIIPSKALETLPNNNEIVQHALLRNPSGRLTNSDDIAKLVGFLVSENSAWITGQIIQSDGGEQLQIF